VARNGQDGSLADELGRVARGDRQAFARLYEATAPRLFGTCLRMFGDRGAAEEALQDGFVRIWEKAQLYDPAKGEAFAWIVTLVRRCAIDRLRKVARPTVSLDELDPDGRYLAIDTGGPAAGVAIDLKNCLEKLGDAHRKAVLLTYYYGLTNEELSDVLKSPLGTVKSWVRRGLVQLKLCLEQ
jgi:RNA polymerase sigma-70 factor (ECF subfamily)